MRSDHRATRPRYHVIIEPDLPVVMTDGTVLRGDLYRPRVRGRVPVIVQRHPYDKSSPWQSALLLDPVDAAAAGFGVFIQDCRGRFASDGKFVPFASEASDGRDTLEWISSQSWNNGATALIGGSYGGMAAWAAASARPPSLRAMVLSMTPASPYSFLYRGGIFAQFQGLSWVVPNLVPNIADRLAANAELPQGRTREIARLVDNLGSLLAAPLVRQAEAIADVAPFYREWVRHPFEDSYWLRLQVLRPNESLDIPVLNIGGWYDIATEATLDTFKGLVKGPGPSRDSRLLMGPWHHWLPLTGLVGEYDFGIAAGQSFIDLQGRLLSWFAHWLRGEPQETEPSVEYFAMGVNEWRKSADWPPPGTVAMDWYLRSSGDANGLAGGGELRSDPSLSAATDALIHDPALPVPTRGGGLCCWPQVAQGGVFDQRFVQSREDVLVYTTPPMAHGIELVGAVSAQLWVDVAHLPCELHIRVSHVDRAGYSRNLCSKPLRIATDTYVGPHLPLHLVIGQTADVIPQGHRLRLDISASNFPEFAVAGRRQRIVLRHGPAEPSTLTVNGFASA